MTTFPAREKAFEDKFALDQAIEFKAKARCDHLLGLWAAPKLGLVGPAIEDYARALIVSDIETHDVVDKISKDFAAKGVPHSQDQIRDKMAELMASARAAIKAGR